MAIALLIGTGQVLEGLDGTTAADGGTLNIFINNTSIAHPGLTADIGGLTPLGATFQLSSSGRVTTPIYSDGAVRAQVLDSNGAQIFLQDDWQGPAGSGTATVYQKTIYLESATAPPTPAGNNPAGWADNPPVGASNTIWASSGLVTVVGEILQGAWSDPVAWSGASMAATRYYILSQDSGVIKNGIGTLTYEARMVTQSGDDLISTGTIQLYEGPTLITEANGYAAGSDGYTAVLDSGDINGRAIIELKDGPTGQALDSAPAVDLIDGTAATTVIISTPEGVNFNRAPNGGSWSDGDKTYPIQVIVGGVSIANTSVTVTLDTGTGLLTAVETGSHPDVAVTFPINGTESIVITAVHNPSGVSASESVFTSVGGDRGDPGADGRTIISGNGAPSDALGLDGDYYVDTGADVFYGPKAGGVWPAGDPILVGADGAPGTVTYNGTGAPSDALGIDGDYYMRDDTVQFYGPKGTPTGGSWAGVTIRNLAGTPGANGTTWLSGNGVPSNAIGANGDFYLDTTNDNYHGPKAGGVWPAAVNIVGSDGINGSVIHSGSGAPPGAVGAIGDYYFRTDTSQMYGPKINTGNWTGAAVTSIQGAAGNDGTLMFGTAAATSFTPTVSVNYAATVDGAPGQIAGNVLMVGSGVPSSLPPATTDILIKRGTTTIKTITTTVPYTILTIINPDDSLVWSYNVPILFPTTFTGTADYSIEAGYQTGVSTSELEIQITQQGT